MMTLTDRERFILYFIQNFDYIQKENKRKDYDEFSELIRDLVELMKINISLGEARDLLLEITCELNRNLSIPQPLGEYR